MTTHALEVMHRDWWEVIVDAHNGDDACVYRGHSLVTARRIAIRERHDGGGSVTVYLLDRWGCRIH